MAESSEAAPFVSLEGVTVRYTRAAPPAVQDLSLSARRGEVVTLLGPSGCGKTTALRVIAGLERPEAGVVRLGDNDITSWPAERRRMGFVFQNYALFPHLSVAENVAFGLRVRRVAKSEIGPAVTAALETVDLAGYEPRRVDRLSGGQQQRVALARALAIKPDVLLLDEPLSNLDASLREQTREALRDILGKLRVTTFFVTHDQSEAFAFSDQIVLMRAGRLVEAGRPELLYREPETRFTAEFLGAANIIPAAADGDGRHVVVGAHEMRIAVGDWSLRARGAKRGDGVLLVARPESLEITESAGPDAIAGRVVDEIFLGASYRLAIAIEGLARPLRLHSPRRAGEGHLWVRFPEAALRAIVREEESQQPNGLGE